MRAQRKEWTCGAAAVVNALRVFGIRESETRIAAVAGTVAPRACAHCSEFDAAMTARRCRARSIWKCSCAGCLGARRLWRRDCSVGTEPRGIREAVRAFGGAASSYQSDSRDAAWQWIWGSLLHGRAIILCLDSWAHWVTAVGIGGGRVVIFDPYPSLKNKSECHLSHLTKDRLMARWWNGRRWAGNDKRLYAISVARV